MLPLSELPKPVLILEDEINMQVRLENILFQLGYVPIDIQVTHCLKEAFEAIAAGAYKLALIDLGLPDGNGIQVIEQLHQHQPKCLMLVISAWSTQQLILQAIQAGASGYFLKERDDVEVSLAIRSLLRGGAPIDPFIAQHILKNLNQPTKKIEYSHKKELLSARELEILQLVAEGLSNKEIAEKISISRYTVECHIKHIYKKLSTSGRSKAVYVARDIGLLP